MSRVRPVAAMVQKLSRAVERSSGRANAYLPLVCLVLLAASCAESTSADKNKARKIASEVNLEMPLGKGLAKNSPLLGEWALLESGKESTPHAIIFRMNEIEFGFSDGQRKKRKFKSLSFTKDKHLKIETNFFEIHFFKKHGDILCERPIFHGQKYMCYQKRR